MIIECSHCRAKYQYDEARFNGKASKKIRCAKCQQVFEIVNPAPAEPAAAPQPDAAPAPPPAPRPAPPRPAEPAPMETTQAMKRRPPEDLDAPPLEEPPRNTDERNADVRLPDGLRLSLAVINGPNAGVVHRVDKPRMTIGRSGADIVLNDTEASRVHAVIEIRDTYYLLEDLGSTNGTLMYGERIEGLIELQSHSEFQIGASTLMWIVTGDT